MLDDRAATASRAQLEAQAVATGHFLLPAARDQILQPVP